MSQGGQMPWRGDGSTAEKTAALAIVLKGHVGTDEPAVLAMACAIVGYRIAVIGCLLMDAGRRSKHDAWDEVVKHCSAAIEVLHAVVGEELTSRYGDGFSEDDVDALMHAGQHEIAFGAPQDAITDALCGLSVALIDLLTPKTNDTGQRWTARRRHRRGVGGESAVVTGQRRRRGRALTAAGPAAGPALTRCVSELCDASSGSILSTV